jgi:hypothetical protein
MWRKIAILFACFAPIVLIAGNPATLPQGQSAAAAQKNTPATSAKRLGPVETLSGTIANVNLKSKLMIVTSSSVSYNFVLGPSTRILTGQRQIKLAELPSEVNKLASVRFVPTRHGNLASSIDFR